MLPARQSLHALEPLGDRRIVFGDIESEFSGWIVEICGHRNIGDRRLFADEKVPSGQPLVDDCEISVDPALEEREDGGVAGRPGEILEKSKWPQESIYFLVVKNDPTQGFEFFVLALRFELARRVGRGRSGSRPIA